MLEESKSARKKRLLYTFVHKSISIAYTALLFGLDLYFMFSTGLIFITEHDQIIGVGPLIMSVCDHGIECRNVLFYMVTSSDPQTLSLIIVSLWVPLFLGMIATTLTFWRIHSLIQIFISMVYLFPAMTAYYNDYTPTIVGLSVIVRLLVSIVITVIIGIMTGTRLLLTKYFTDPSDTPILIGKSYGSISEPELDFANDDSESDTSVFYFADSPQKKIES